MPEDARGPTDDVDALLVQPDIELAGIEAHKAAHFDEWNPPLRYEPANMARSNAEDLGHGDGI
jgi:hypothetical protein